MTAAQKQRSTRHDREWDPHGNTHSAREYGKIVMQNNFGTFERGCLHYVRSSHLRGDRGMFDRLRIDHRSGIRRQARLGVGVLLVTVGIAARKSIDALAGLDP